MIEWIDKIYWIRFIMMQFLSEKSVSHWADDWLILVFKWVDNDHFRLVINIVFVAMWACFRNSFSLNYLIDQIRKNFMLRELSIFYSFLSRLLFFWIFSKERRRMKFLIISCCSSSKNLVTYHSFHYSTIIEFSWVFMITDEILRSRHDTI